MNEFAFFFFLNALHWEQGFEAFIFSGNSDFVIFDASFHWDFHISFDPPSNLPDLEGVISQKGTLMDPSLGQKGCRRVALQWGGTTFGSLLIVVNVMTPINYIHIYNQPK